MARCLRAALLILALVAPAAAQDAGTPTVVVSPTAVAPIPLADVAARSDDVGVFLAQVDERWQPSEALLAIEAGLPALRDQLREKVAAAAQLLDSSPSLRDVDNLSEALRQLRTQLEGWSETLTSAAAGVDKEVGGLDALRAVWRATRDQARAQSAPPALIERINGTLQAIAATRREIEARRGRLLERQDEVVALAASTREPLRDLNKVRAQSFGRLLIADRGPLWSTYPPEGLRAALSAAAQATGDELRLSAAYLEQRLPRVLLQLAVFVTIAILLRRARGRVAGLAREDDSLAVGARIFEVPAAAAAVVTLIATPWFLPDVPLLLQDLIGVVAVIPTLLVLRRLVEPPAVPALWAIGVFYVIDQITRSLSTQPFVEQLLFTVERLAVIAFIAWFARSGRLRAMFERDSRWVQPTERAARAAVIVVALATVAGGLGFMQLARYLQEAMVDSAYAALVLFGGLQVLEAVWAYVLRTRVAQRLHMVARHRALLQRRGERLLGWIAFLVWVVVVLRNARVLDPLTDVVREAFGAQLTIGSLTLSLGAVAAFAITVWLSFAFSRFLRFILDEDVYPRVQMAAGMPYAVSSLLHYAVLLVGFLMALAATGMQLDRFALLAGAFGVGIGFGLQAVVNNFVSGLILLFERPVKVGDVIQVGTLTGEVRHIGIRASRIRTADGADAIVPNGDLISGAVTNWTLSDRMRRIDVPVGVAYGTDPEAVIGLLRSVAVNHPLVVEHPAPQALFLAFGNNALSFELRCWTDNFDKWVVTRSELTMAINRALNEAGIGIPFPQRDLHISGALPVRVVDEEKEKKS
jgi:small-conductance mechanosensitive channel